MSFLSDADEQGVLLSSNIKHCLGCRPGCNELIRVLGLKPSDLAGFNCSNTLFAFQPNATKARRLRDLFGLTNRELMSVDGNVAYYLMTYPFTRSRELRSKGLAKAVRGPNWFELDEQDRESLGRALDYNRHSTLRSQHLHWPEEL